MKQIKKFKTLEEGIVRLQQLAKQETLSLGTIIRFLPGKGLVLLLLFLSLPFCQPLQIPGLSLPFGLVIAYGGLRMAFGKHVWISQRLLAKKINSRTFTKITSKVLALAHTLNRWIYPRLNWACHSSSMQIINGLTVFILGIFLAMPLPIPLSNLTAAWSIFLIALGIIKDDGLFVLFGYLITILTLLFFIVMAVTLKHVI